MNLCSHPSGFWKALLLTASFLTFRSLPCDAQLTIYPRTPIAIVGQNVLLSVHGIQTGSQAFSWFQGLGLQNLILSYNISSKANSTGPGYTGREVLYENASLLIKNVQVTDGRNYTFQEIRPNLSTATAYKQLQVYNSVSKPSITASPTRITEGEGSVTFQCHTRDKNITILWIFKNRAIPVSKRFSLSKDNKTLTLLQARREDNGFYQCEVWNQVSGQSSDDISLIVNYGPDQVKITQEPGSHVVHTIQVKANSTLALRCKAESHPSAQYKWLFNNSMLVTDRDNLVLQGESLLPGKYTCKVQNNLTNHSAATSVYIYIGSPDTPSSDSSHSSLTIVSVLMGILVVTVLLSVLAYLLREKAQGYSQERLGGPGQKEKKKPSMKYSDFGICENDLQLQSKYSNGQMVTPPQDMNPYSTLSEESLKDPYQMVTPPQDMNPYSTLSGESLEDPYQTLTFASVDVYEQISRKEFPQEKDEELRD